MVRQNCDEEGNVRQEKKDVEVERQGMERGQQAGKMLKGLRKVKKHDGIWFKEGTHTNH